MKDQTTQILVESIPAEVLELLGPPPLLSTEDTNLYSALVAHLAQSVQPRDIITWMLIKDLADHQVEIARYRRIKTSLLEQPYRKKVAALVGRLETTLRDQPDELREAAEKEKAELDKSNKSAGEIKKLKANIVRKLARDISKSRTHCQEHLECLTAARVTDAEVAASFQTWIQQHEQIDVLLQAAEQRFSAALKELERHVHGFGRFLREEMDKVIEGEVIEPEREGNKLVELTSPARISAENASRFDVGSMGESAHGDR
jgi:hypothetical protein